MSPRVLVEVRCRRRGHVIAKVLAAESGPVVWMPRYAVGRKGADGRIRHDRASLAHHDSAVTDTFGEFTTWAVVCQCGADFLLTGARLAKAVDDGARRVLLDPQS